MSNCSHEAWDFGALQCSDCGAVKDHVTDAEFAKLEAEAQALREEVAALRTKLAMAEDAAAKGDAARQQCGGMEMEIEDLRAELATLRARVVVVPERKLLNAGVPGLNRNSGWNACLDELARLNGKTVSEGLLLRVLYAISELGDRHLTAIEMQSARELRALLNQDKENGDHAA